MSKKLTTITLSLIISFALLIILANYCSAEDFPKLYSGKARAVLGSEATGRTIYSEEIAWPQAAGDTGDPLPQGQNKVLVGSTNSSKYFAPNPLNPNERYDTILSCMTSTNVDCIVWSYFAGDTSYRYSLGANAFHQSMKIYHGDVKVDGTSVDSDNILVYPSKQLVGDVYSADQDKFNQFTPFGDHLGINNPLLKETWKLNNYQVDPNAISGWDRSNFPKNTAMNQNINRLKNQAINPTNLATALISPACNSSVYPEGQIISADPPLNTSGDLSSPCLRTLLVTDKINSSGVTIPGSINIRNSTKFGGSGVVFGIIATGDITITIPANTSLTMKAAIFTPGTVTINGVGAGFILNGSIVASDININTSTAIIKYDNQLASQAPPGFNFLANPSSSTIF